MIAQNAKPAFNLIKPRSKLEGSAHGIQRASIHFESASVRSVGCPPDSADTVCAPSVLATSVRNRNWRKCRLGLRDAVSASQARTAPAIDFECSQLFRASSSQLTGPWGPQKPAPWLRQMRSQPRVRLLRKCTVYGLNGQRLYFIISLFKVTYKSPIQVSRNFHALFPKTLENSDTCD